MLLSHGELRVQADEEQQRQNNHLPMRLRLSLIAQMKARLAAKPPDIPPYLLLALCESMVSPGSLLCKPAL